MPGLEDLTDVERLPCGCITGKHLETKAFVLLACKPTCEVAAYANEEARKQGKPIGQLDMREHDENIAANVPALSPLFNPSCPHCGSKLDAFTSADRSAQPSPGDVSVCAYCKRLLFFTEHGFRKPTDDERTTLEANEQIQAMRAVAKLVWDDKP